MIYSKYLRPLNGLGSMLKNLKASQRLLQNLLLGLFQWQIATQMTSISSARDFSTTEFCPPIHLVATVLARSLRGGQDIRNDPRNSTRSSDRIRSKHWSDAAAPRQGTRNPVVTRSARRIHESRHGPSATRSHCTEHRSVATLSSARISPHQDGLQDR